MMHVIETAVYTVQVNEAALMSESKVRHVAILLVWCVNIYLKPLSLHTTSAMPW